LKVLKSEEWDFEEEIFKDFSDDEMIVTKKKHKRAKKKKIQQRQVH
jgi:hypothetical protein